MARSSGCGVESRSWNLCPWAKHLTINTSHHPGVNGYLWGQSIFCDWFSFSLYNLSSTGCILPRELRWFTKWNKWPSNMVQSAQIILKEFRFIRVNNSHHCNERLETINTSHHPGVRRAEMVLVIDLALWALRGSIGWTLLRELRWFKEWKIWPR